MALRNKLPDNQANYPPPILGINLLAAPEDMKPGEACWMTNCYYWRGVQSRLGSTALNGSTLGAFRIRGGHRFYYGANKKRLIAYSTKVAVIDDSGTATNLTTAMTSDLDTFFQTWSITGKVYVSNGTDKLFEYDGTTWQSVDTLGGAVNVPNGCTVVRPILDRLLAINPATGFIERTNARVAHIWSSGSSWATFRPSLVGPFVTMQPHTLKSVLGDLTPGIVATQANAMYFITGTDFGTDVTAASASAGASSSIQLIDSNIGSSSPYSLCTVPGVGTFGFSSDANVWMLPFGSASPVIIGDKLRSTSSTKGIESTNLAALNQVWMTYWDRKLILGVPTGNNTYCDTYFWLDIRSLQEHPDRGFVWYGPHNGFTINRVWPENALGDNTLFAGEGNSATGAFVYKLFQPGVYKDAVGATTPNIAYDYKSLFYDFGAASQEKYVQTIQLDCNTFTGTPTVDLSDVTGDIVTGLTLTAM